MIKAIAFDVDNTLIDFLSMKKKSARAAARAMLNAGLKSDEEKLYKEIFAIYDEYGIEYQKTFAKVLVKYNLSLNEFEKIQQSAISAYIKCKFECLKPYPEVIPTLEKLGKKYKLAILTDAPRNKAWQRLILCGLDGFFETVITHDDTKEHKPHALPFKALLSALNLKPEEILMVGDNPERDVKGAKALGMKTALAKYGQVLNLDSKEKADFELENFSDILRIL